MKMPTSSDAGKAEASKTTTAADDVATASAKCRSTCRHEKDETTQQQRKRLVVTVRPIEERDQCAVCEMWISGLKQTLEYNNAWYVRPFLYLALDQIATKACEPNGEMGPQGSNLVQTWRKKRNRCMFVAIATTSASTSTPMSSPALKHDDDASAAASETGTGGSNEEKHEAVVGCVGVKRGVEESDSDEDDISEVASIWRLSVKETARRQGVGQALMRAAEQWAIHEQSTNNTNNTNPNVRTKSPQQPAIRTMQLVTMKPAAGEFYRSQGYVRNDNEPIVPHNQMWNPLMRMAFLYVLPPIYYYRKTLQKTK